MAPDQSFEPADGERRRNFRPHPNTTRPAKSSDCNHRSRSTSKLRCILVRRLPITDLNQLRPKPAPDLPLAQSEPLSPVCPLRSPLPRFRERKHRLNCRGYAEPDLASPLSQPPASPADRSAYPRLCIKSRRSLEQIASGLQAGVLARNRDSSSRLSLATPSRRPASISATQRGTGDPTTSNSQATWPIERSPAWQRSTISALSSGAKDDGGGSSSLPQSPFWTSLLDLRPTSWMSVNRKKPSVLARSVILDEVARRLNR